MVAMTEVFRVYLARGYFCPPTIPTKQLFRPNTHDITQSLGALGTGSVALFQLGLVHINRFYHHILGAVFVL